MEPLFQFPVLQSLGVNTLRVVDGAIPLSNSNASGSNSGQISACVQTNISESLNNVSFTNPANLQTKLGHILLLFDKVIQTMEHTSTSCTGPTMDTTLVDWFSSNTGTGILVSVSNGVSICIS